MDPQPSISCVVPTLNRRDDLLAFAETLVGQSVLPQELILVDAGDLPDLDRQVERVLKGSGIRLRYVRSAAGTSLQRNIALDMVRGELVFLLEDDVLLEPDYIERTLEVFALPFDPPVGGVLGTFTNPPRPRGWQQEYFRLFGMTHAVEGDQAGMSTSGGARWLLEPTRPVPVPLATTGRTAYRRDAIGSNRFAEYLPGYTMGEDVEFSFRIARHWTLVQTPHARLFHTRSEAGRLDLGDRVGRLIYSRFYFFRKHLPKRPRTLAAYAWTNLGITAFYSGVGLILTPMGGKLDVLRGIAWGYRKVARELLDEHASETDASAPTTS